MAKDIKKKDMAAIDHLPGVEVDISDDDKINPQEVREEVKQLNNNPRNTDTQMP